jgi:molybdate transport system ATP-binding protein
MTGLEFRCRHRYPSGFSLDVEFAAGGGVTALFGPSGSGKTSVLGMIAGLRAPDEGRVRLGEQVLFDSAQHVNLKPEARRLGVVFQDLLLFPHLTVRGNLAYGLKRRGPSAAAPLARVVEVLELGPVLDRHPRSLSGGERQRVALGRALLSQPRLLLLDEPWSALDDALKDRVLAYLERAFAEWSVPALVVSHDQGAVRRLAGQVVVLREGRVVGAGAPDEALGRPAALGLKDASQPVNLLRVEDPHIDQGQWIGRVGPHTLRLPPLSAPPRGPLYVQFLPGEVTLSRGPASGLSVRNRLAGRVRDVVPLPEGVFVAVDVGQTVWSEVTEDSAAELGLAPGVEVACLVKTHSLRVIAGG